VADVALDVEIRSDKGKGANRKLRAKGRIPGVCYGKGRSPVPVSLDPRRLERLLASSATGINTLIDLRVAGGGDFDGRVVLVKELQRDPVSARALHADFYAVDLEQAIQVAVPIQVTGTAPGVTNGGILDHALRELQIECLPRAIPEQILVDVGQLEIGMSLHVRDLALPEGVKLMSDPDLSVVSVVVPAALEEETAAAAPAEGEAVPAEGEAAAEGAEGAEPKEGAEAKGEKGGAKPAADKAAKAEKPEKAEKGEKKPRG
jgi:large subunit ribosomal protein L25